MTNTTISNSLRSTCCRWTGAAALLLTAALAYAGTTTWNVTPSGSPATASGAWTTAGNWTTSGGSTPPAAADSVVIDLATGGISTLASSTSKTIKCNDITFGGSVGGSTEGGWIVSGTSMSVASGTITVNQLAAGQVASLVEANKGTGWPSSGVVKKGVGTLQVTGSYDGSALPLAVQNGALQLMDGNAAKSHSGQVWTLGDSSGNSGMVLLGGGSTPIITTGTPLVASGAGSSCAVAGGASVTSTMSWILGSTTSTYPVNFGGSSGNQPNLSLVTGGTGLTLSGNMNFNGGLVMNKGTMTISGNNTACGGVTISIGGMGKLILGSDTGYPSGDNFLVSGTSAGTLDLNGHPATLAVTLTQAVASGNPQAIDNSSATPVNLTINSGNVAGYGVIKNSGGAVSLIKASAGTLSIASAQSYTGNTAVSAGTLSLTAAGSIASSPTITIAPNATLDVSTLTTPLTLAAGQGLVASGAGTPGSINTASGFGLTLGANSPLTFSARDGNTAHAPLSVTGAGTVTIPSSAIVTVNVANGGTPLSAGDYKLIAIGAGNTTAAAFATTAPFPIVTGDGLGGLSAVLVISGGELYLRALSCTTFGFSPAAGALAGIVENAPYTITIGASAGTAPYSYSILSGSLPPGLSLGANDGINNGIISGTPTLMGHYSFTIAAIDANSCAGSAAYTLLVQGTRIYVTLPGQTLTPGSGNSGPVTPQTAGTPFNVTLTALDVNTNIVAGYSGSQTITYSGPGNSPSAATPTYQTSVTFASGQATVPVTLVKAETATITAADNVHVYPGVASSSLVVNQSSVNAGQSVISANPASVSADGVSSSSILVTEKDAYGNALTASGTTPILNSDFGTLSAVTDNANGTYKATLTSASTGTAHVTGTIGSIAIGTPATVTFVTPTYYRSVASGNWSSASTWSVSTDGVTYGPAANAPSSSDSTIEIVSPHNVNVDAAVTADQLVVDNGATLTIAASQVLTLADGPGTDLDVSGTIDNKGGITNAPSATPTIAFESTGVYTHDRDGGAIPVATWADGSLCQVTGLTATVLTAAIPSTENFYDFTYNCTGQTASSLALDVPTVRHIIKCQNANGHSWYCYSALATYPHNWGQLQVAGSTMNLWHSSTSTTAQTLNVGSVTVSSGATLTWDGSSGVLYTMNVSGDWDNGGAVTITTAGVDVHFVGTGTVTMGTSSTSFRNVFVDSGAVTTLGGNLTVASGKTLSVASLASLDFNGKTVTAPGATLHGALTMEVVKTGANSFTGSKLTQTSGTLTYGGTLTVSASGPDLASGDSIPLFSASTYGGGFSSVTGPTLPASVAADKSQLTGGTGGNIVLSASSLTPPTLSGGKFTSPGNFQLTFDGPSGQTYTVLKSANVGASLSSWAHVANGTFAGSPVLWTDTSATGNAFYRIQSPQAP